MTKPKSKKHQRHEDESLHNEVDFHQHNCDEDDGFNGLAMAKAVLLLLAVVLLIQFLLWIGSAAKSALPGMH